MLNSFENDQVLQNIQHHFLLSLGSSLQNGFKYALHLGLLQDIKSFFCTIGMTADCWFWSCPERMFEKKKGFKMEQSGIGERLKSRLSLKTVLEEKTTGSPALALSTCRPSIAIAAIISAEIGTRFDT